jgi:hypothetical protein
MTLPQIICRGCGGGQAKNSGHPWSKEAEPLCKRCWRWGMLWFVGQRLAADRQATMPYDP